MRYLDLTLGFLLAALLLVLSCCPSPGPKPFPSPPPSDGMCVIDPEPVSAGVCQGLFTLEGRACVLCGDVQGCIDPATQVYCVVGTCAGDEACHASP